MEQDSGLPNVAPVEVPIPQKPVARETDLIIENNVPTFDTGIQSAIVHFML